MDKMVHRKCEYQDQTFYVTDCELDGNISFMLTLGKRKQNHGSVERER